MNDEKRLVNNRAPFNSWIACAPTGGRIGFPACDIPDKTQLTKKLIVNHLLRKKERRAPIEITLPHPLSLFIY
ncbi:hypothetical protein D7D25_15190 [Proteiniphilum sp. X52]|nr:hypothetical protein D7D25_15190 [Proteiniphilum sp. X52]